MTTLVDRLAPDDLWAIVQPLLPPPPAPLVGRPAPHHPGSPLLAAVVFMARTFTPFRLLPARELGCAELRRSGGG